MTRYIAHRLLQAVLVLWGAVTLSFAVLHLTPGDPVRILLGGSGDLAAAASPQQVAQLRAELGLDQPIWMQYLNFVTGALRGDFGTSFSTGQPVTAEIAQALPVTIELGVAAIVLSVVVALAFAVVGMLLPGAWLRSAFQSVTVLGVALPSFWVAIVALQVFSFRLGWLPAFGSGGPASLVLPALTMTVLTAGTLAQVLTRGLKDALAEPFADTARAKGLSQARVVLGHALRNASLPVFTMVGMMVGGILGGTAIVETIFGRQGVGMLFVEAVRNHDFPLIQALIILTGGTFVLVTLVVDLLYPLIDPRVIAPYRRGAPSRRRPLSRLSRSAGSHPRSHRPESNDAEVAV